MTLFQELRALVFLRRIARALEAQVELQKKQQRKTSKVVEMSAPSYEEWQDVWEKKHET